MGANIHYRRLPIQASRPLRAVVSDPTAAETGRQIRLTFAVTFVLLIATAYQLVQTGTA